MIPLSSTANPIASNPIRFQASNVEASNKSFFTVLSFPVTLAGGKHPFPFRTRQLSPPAPMVLRAQVCGRVGRRRELFFRKRPMRNHGPSVSPRRSPRKPRPSEDGARGGLSLDSTCLMILLPWMEGGNAVAPAVRRGSRDVSSVL